MFVVVDTDLRKGSKMNLTKKINRAVRYGMMAWAMMLIVTGVGALREFAWVFVTFIATFLAFRVEKLFSRLNKKLIVECCLDLLVGLMWFVVVQYTASMKLIQAIGSEISIPKMSILLGYIIIAFVAQLEVRIKREYLTRRNYRETAKDDGDEETAYFDEDDDADGHDDWGDYPFVDVK